MLKWAGGGGGGGEGEKIGGAEVKSGEWGELEGRM